MRKGTEAYLPAEVLDTLTYSKAADIYAIGLLIWEAYHGLFWQVHHDVLKRLGCAVALQVARMVELTTRAWCCVLPPPARPYVRGC